MSKCLILFVEGETEVEFYKRIIFGIRQMRPDKKFNTQIDIRCVKGVGNFKKDVLRKFKKEILPSHEPECEYTIVLCSDTDVFEIAENPPVNWTELIKELTSAGAKKVIHIQAKHSIEDWFLYDTAGILSFLRLGKKVKIPSSGTGYMKLQRLYAMANNMYYKGMKSNGMIAKLDIDKIVKHVKKELKPLYKALGVDLK